MSLTHHDSMMAACCLPVRNTVIVTGGKLPWSRRSTLPMKPSQCSWPILAAWRQSAVRHQEHFVILQCFDTVWWSDTRDIQPVQSSSTTVPKRFGNFLVLGQTWVILSRATDFTFTFIPLMTRVTTCLEYLEMSGNYTDVREMSGISLKVMEMSGNCQEKILSRKIAQKLS